MKNDTVLITGGSGFIGSNLALKLLKKGYKVNILDIMSKQIHGMDYTKSELFKKIKGKVNFFYGDVQNKNDWLKALVGTDIVIHLAAETGTGQSMYEIERYIDVNIKGTAVFLDILTNSKHSIKKVIIASSRAIYGEGKYICPTHGYVYPTERCDSDMINKDFNIKCPICSVDVDLTSTTEDSKIHPTSIYGFTKQGQEEMCMIVGKSLKIPVVAFRYQNVYGPGQSLKNPYTGILSIFSTRIKNGNDINVFEDGLESRDFVYIDDVVDATILGMEKDEANYESFNVGTGEAVDVLTVANTLISKYKSNVKIVTNGNYRLGDIRHNYADISKAIALLGYKPKIDFKTGISNFIDWVNTQDIETDTYDKSIEELKIKGLYK